jgi:hypothetical protein
MNDWFWADPDYVVDTQSRFFIDVGTPSQDSAGRFAPLDYSDTSLLTTFHQPGSYNTPTGEIWRLYSQPAQTAGGKRLEVLVGYSLKAPWKPVETLDSQIPAVDAALRRDADKIARSLSATKASLRLPRPGLAVDGYQLVDSITQEVAEQGPYVPSLLPPGVPLPTPGRRFYVSAGELHLAQTATDTDGRLSATSFLMVADLQWVICLLALGFVVTGAIARTLARRFLRKYFAKIGMQIPSVDQAIRDGEGQNVEFKRGLSEAEGKVGSVDNEILKSVAAFANTNDGVIFLGIDDAGHVKGLPLDFTGRDRLEQKLQNIIRDRVRPSPPVKITFEDLRGLWIAEIAVAEGDAPPYMMGGAIYVRRGASDFQAQQEDVVRLVTQYA